MVYSHRDQVRPRGMPKRFSRFYGFKRFKGVGAAHQVRSAAQCFLNPRFPNMRYSQKMRRLKAGMRRRVTCDSLVSSFRAQARNLCHLRPNDRCLEIRDRKPAMQETFGHRPIDKAAKPPPSCLFLGKVRTQHQAS